MRRRTRYPHPTRTIGSDPVSGLNAISTRKRGPSYAPALINFAEPVPAHHHPVNFRFALVGGRRGGVGGHRCGTPGLFVDVRHRSTSGQRVASLSRHKAVPLAVCEDLHTISADHVFEVKR